MESDLFSSCCHHHPVQAPTSSHLDVTASPLVSWPPLSSPYSLFPT